MALAPTSGLKWLAERCALLGEVARCSRRVVWTSGSQGEALGRVDVVSLPLVKEKPHNRGGVVGCLQGTGCPRDQAILRDPRALRDLAVSSAFSGEKQGTRDRQKASQVLARTWESPVKPRLVGSQWGQHGSSARGWVVSEH